MTDKVSVSPGFGCASLPLSTGRIGTRLPFLEYRSPSSNVTLWLSRDNNKRSTTGFLKPLIVDIPKKQQSGQNGVDPQSILPTKLAQHSFYYTKQQSDSQSTTGEFADLRRVISLRRHTAPERKGAYTPFATQNRPYTCQSWSSDDNLVGDFRSGRNSAESENWRCFSRAGLSRYTPLPAIGKIGKADNPEDKQLYLHQSLNNLNLDAWSFPEVNAPAQDRKLPPILRPLVRSRTFTILNFENQDEGDQSWTMDEKEEETCKPESRRNSGSSLERSLNIFLVVIMPDGATEENHFDAEDTFQDVFRFAVKEDQDSTYWRFVTDDEDSQRVFTDFSQTLADAHIQSKTTFHLRRTDDL